MPGLAYSKEEIQQRLEALPDKMRVAFGLSCCERMFPNYRACKTKINWGDERPLRMAMDTLWKWLDGENLSQSHIRKLMNECEAVTPNSEDFLEVLTTVAQDACFAICCVLEYFLLQKVERIAQASSYANDTLNFWVQELQDPNPGSFALVPNNPERQERIRLHPLMQRELARQDADLKLLASHPDMGLLKAQWRAPAKSNIDL